MTCSSYEAANVLPSSVSRSKCLWEQVGRRFSPGPSTVQLQTGKLLQHRDRKTRQCLVLWVCKVCLYGLQFKHAAKLRFYCFVDHRSALPGELVSGEMTMKSVDAAL